MKTIPPLRACLAIMCLLSGLLAFAAEPPKPSKTETKPKPASEAQNNADPWQRRLPELQAENLPLSEVANQLSDHFPEVNFVLDPFVKDMVVSLKLRSVTLEDIFAALDIATQRSVPTVDPATGLPVPGLLLQVSKVSDRMVSFTAGKSPAPEVTQPICRAFSLARYLAGKSEEEARVALTEIEEALAVCWKLLKDADRSSTKFETPQLSLHRATKLLIVVGQLSQVEVVEQVISQLESDSAGAGSAPGRGASANPLGPGEANRALAERYGLPGTPPPVESTKSPPGRK